MQVAARRLHCKLSRASLLSQAEPRALDSCAKPSRAVRTLLLGKHTCLAVRTRQVNLQVEDELRDTCNLFKQSRHSCTWRTFTRVVSQTHTISQGLLKGSPHPR
uniref:Uncharacterized protein n=1 Tax=Cucumis melo TaxID=3656 RepID=A0A9I9E886_CUCME